MYKRQTQRVEAVSPAGRLASAVQLTWLADDPLQSQALPPLADTTLKGDGTWSVTVGARASDGPLLVTSVPSGVLDSVSTTCLLYTSRCV